MTPIRPEVLLFVHAADSIMHRATSLGEPLCKEETHELVRCIGKLEEFLRMDGHLKELD